MTFLQVLISGVSQGCIYGLIALGFVLIYKATETVSFAQGELMMLGAFAGLALMTFARLAVLARRGAGDRGDGGCSACCSSAWSIRPILGQPAFSIVMLTIGIGYVARGLITMIPAIGTETHTLPVPYKDQVWNVGALVLNVGADGGDRRHRRAVRCCCTRCSATARSASRCRPRRRTSSPPTTWASRCKRLNGLVWGLAAAVAAIAGLLLAPITFVHANMGFIGLKAFPAAVVGGFGSLPGAIVGGLIIGIVESLAGFYLPEGFKDIAAYIVVLLMLVVKPNGLFGEKLRKKV